ncbi:integrase domain-containing protein [Marinobacterium stanieri]|uniref:integrase domain-containing protein n=1 Tax=Marinobacterium stanieri TaxID=49186 RepID=UPI003A8DFAD9
MARRRKRHQKNNFGFGRSITYAVKKLLSYVYGGGHHVTRATHGARFSIFIDFLSEYDVHDARFITQEHANYYAELIQRSVSEGRWSLAYGHNLISSFNVVMRHFRRNSDLKIKASDYLVQRNYVRKKTPYVNDSSINQSIEILRSSGKERAAAVLGLVRCFGLRLREAILMDLDRCWREYEKTGYITILEGTKGGRKSEDRNLKVFESGVQALKNAILARPNGSKNLIDRNETLKGFINSDVKNLRNVLKEYGILNIREIRTYFMIELFENTTCLPAPVKNATTLKNEDLLKMGYERVSRAAGHNRLSVARSYVG